MFITVKKRQNKHKDATYNVYISERFRVDGKLKSQDTFIVSLQESDIIDNIYYKKVSNAGIIDAEKRMINKKLESIRQQLFEEIRDDKEKVRFYECVPDERYVSLKSEFEDIRTENIKLIERDLEVSKKLFQSVEDTAALEDKISIMQKVIDFYIGCSDTKTVTQANELKEKLEKEL